MTERPGFDVALLQLDYPEGEPAAERLQRVVGGLSGCRRGEVVLLPELWDVRYFDFDAYPAAATDLALGPLAQLAGVAARQGLVLVAGSVLERDGELLHNTIAVIGPDGGLLGTYRKTHLFPYGSREAELLSPGDGARVVDTPAGRVGLGTCFDLRFPEHFAAMREDGADVFAVPAAWPAARIDDWEVLCRARAMENQTPLLGCNGAGNCAGTELGGRSLVVDARGRVTAAGGAAPTLLRGRVEPGLSAEWRRDFPMRSV